MFPDLSKSMCKNGNRQCNRCKVNVGTNTEKSKRVFLRVLFKVSTYHLIRKEFASHRKSATGEKSYEEGMGESIDRLECNTRHVYTRTHKNRTNEHIQSDLYSACWYLFLYQAGSVIARVVPEWDVYLSEIKRSISILSKD